MSTHLHTNDALINTAINTQFDFYRFFFLFSSFFLSPPLPSLRLFFSIVVLSCLSVFLGRSSTLWQARDVAWISLDLPVSPWISLSLPVSPCLSLSLPRIPRLLLILSRANLSCLPWTFHLFPIFILVLMAFFVGRDPQLGNRCLISVSKRNPSFSFF